MRASTCRISITSIAVVLALLYAPAALARQDPTETTVSTTPSPSRVGETVTFNARVSVPGAPAQRPTGTMQFEVDGTAVGTPLTLNDAAATFTTAVTGPGQHTVTARYDSNDDAYADSSGTAPHTVEKWSSESSVTVQPDPTVAGQSATFTATVTGQASDGHRPTGTVQFSDDDGSPIGSPVALDGEGVARIDASAAAGTYSVHADYSATATTRQARRSSRRPSAGRRR